MPTPQDAWRGPCFVMERMRRGRGFTLIELAVVVAIIGVLTAAALGIMRMAQSNASLGSATFEFVHRLRGLRATAMRENQDYVFVFADSVTADAMDCGPFNGNRCARWWVLRTPATWSIASFRPTNVSNGGAQYVDTGAMPRGIHLDKTGRAFNVPAPFTGAVLADGDLTTTCEARTCFGFRFAGDGRVLPLFAGVAATAKVGYVFALASELRKESKAADQRVVLVAFPAGIVKVFTD